MQDDNVNEATEMDKNRMTEKKKALFDATVLLKSNFENDSDHEKINHVRLLNLKSNRLNLERYSAIDKSIKELASA